jgi:hypothetical protein
MAQAEKRGLIVKDGIHTFSNGTEWECWASGNCFDCWHYDAKEMGACAFEGAALMSAVSPDLARFFGWTQDAKWDTPDDHRHGWDSPDQCACFRERTDDDGNDNPPPPEPDPTQLVLLADPTEDAALARLMPERETVSA